MVRIGVLRLCPSKIIKPDPTLVPSLDPSVHMRRVLVVILLKLSKVRETFRGVLVDPRGGNFEVPSCFWGKEL